MKRTDFIFLEQNKVIIKNIIDVPRNPNEKVFELYPHPVFICKSKQTAHSQPFVLNWEVFIQIRGRELRALIQIYQMELVTATEIILLFFPSWFKVIYLFQKAFH